MNLIDRLFLVKSIVSREGRTHFRRWRFVQTPLFAIYLHNIARSDEEKDPHDHPFPFVSVILRGGYTEKVWDDSGTLRVYLRRPGSIVVRRAKGEYHKIALLNAKPAWSLVFTGPRIHKLWGYSTARGWLDHVTYHDQKHPKP